ncbi:MAG: Na+/H+ antiporter subunit D, partial [Rhodobacteraceae bacterium]|nr:Na+/H+ antiporter subunit D [Paracoccaceae bacterium]
FWAKLLLARATIEIGSAGLTFMVLGVGFLTLFAMARIWAAVFWSAHPEGDGAITERLPAAMLVPLLALTGAIVYIGIDAGPMVEGAAAIATGLIDPQAYVAAVLGGAE